MDESSAIRSTDLDALISRHSAHTKSLILDPYSSHFLRIQQQSIIRPPLINLGTHARIWSIDDLVNHFINHQKGESCQIINLGAGNDTRYWRLSNSNNGQDWDRIHWIELDFMETTSKKVRTILSKPELLQGLRGKHTLEQGGTALISPHYKLLPIDLNHFNTFAPTLLSNSHISSTLPTLLLAECVFMYLPPEPILDILTWFTTTFKQAGGMSVAYDPFGLDDAFGRVMIRNLAERGLTLPSVASTPTLDSLSQRLLNSGFDIASSVTLKTIRDSVIPKDEILRVAKIERLDEVEELNLVLDHYAITYGVLSDKGIVNGIGF